MLNPELFLLFFTNTLCETSDGQQCQEAQRGSSKGSTSTNARTRLKREAYVETIYKRRQEKHNFYIIEVELWTSDDVAVWLDSLNVADPAMCAKVKEIINDYDVSTAYISSFPKRSKMIIRL